MAWGSIQFDSPRLIPLSCYEGAAGDLQGPFPVPGGWLHLLGPFRHPEGTVCRNHGITNGLLSYLLLLQIIIAMWSVFIIEVVVRMFKGDSAEDVRSDDEADEAQEEESQHYKSQILKEAVGVEGIDFEVWKRHTRAKVASGSSGVSLPGHSDRKEFLNRIGCEKQID
ncbi:hypothetical protein F4779DRAFT_259443 [Xylariaceae sp. FL0662B]|nr:hypothetical protein F4779DRAFT_259443 [Xylariaceae sp. FL0662B]